MKKIFTFCAALLVLICMHANVVTGTCGDNLNWSYDTDTKALVITGSGDMYDYEGSEYWNSNTPWSQVGHEITSVSFNEGITKIGSSAFAGCYNIESIVIPNSVSRIENYAFQSCGNLSSVTLGSGLKYVGYNAFYNCYNVSTTNYMGDVANWCNIQFSSRESNPISFSQNLYINNQELIDLVIPAGVNIISSHAFYNCATIKSITIPKSVKTIGTWALDGIWFDRVNYLGEVGDWCDIEFLGSLSNPMGSTRNFYFNNNKVKNIVIPNTVDTIHQGAFYNACFNSITIPNSVKLIGDYAFSYCSQIIIETTTPPLISNASLNEVTSILVPCAAMDNYLAADIWQFLNINGVNNFKIDLSTTDYGQACVTHTECETNVITIEAFPFYNGIFTQWSDGNTDNPRTITLTQDLTLEAQFEEIPYYTVRLIGNSLRGSIYYEDEFYGESYVERNVPSGTQISFREDGGCGSWLGWSDGSYDRERTIVVTSDTTITSRFDTQTYSVSITAGEGGYLENGDIIREYNDCNREWIYPCAYANEGYYFKGWSDGNTSNCIDIYPYEDIELVAEFAPKEQVTLLLGVDNTSKGMGSVSGSGIFYSGDWVSISATPNAGYHFVEWSDGNGQAYRELYLQHDTTLFATFAAGEYGGKCGENLLWTFNNGHLEITGTGDMDLDNYPAWWNHYDLYWQVTSVSLPEGMTSIYRRAFQEMSFASVVVPASVNYLGAGAFAYNYNLTHFECLSSEIELEGYGDKDYSVLRYCDNLRYFKGQKEMLWYVDSYSNLDTVIITSGEGFDYFYGNTRYIDNSNAHDWEFGEGYIDGFVKEVETLILPEGLQVINDYALYNARYLEQITIPAGITRIGDAAFEDCRSMDTVIFAGNALREIGDWAFYNCHSIKGITIPEGVTEIGKGAFFDCSHLTEITLPASMQTVADNAFGQCAKVAKLTVKAMMPPVVEAETFEDINRNIPLMVPIGTALQYKEADYWCEFNQVIEYEVLSDLENTYTPSPKANSQKLLQNGQLIIVRDGKTYNLMGVEIQ